MLAHVLVPLDGSPLADAALDFALAMLAGTDRRIYGCHAVDTRGVIAETAGLVYAADPLPLIDALRDEGRAIMDAARDKVQAAGVAFTALLPLSDPVDAIVDSARENAVDAIVMGTHGRHGFAHVLLGSTAQGVLRNGEIPVFTLRGPAPLRPGTRPFNRIVVALDDSDPSDAALHFALDLATAESARLCFCTVVQSAELLDRAALYGYDPRPLLADMRAEAGALLDGPLDDARMRDLSADTLVAEGDPCTEIARAVDTLGADLVVIGSHGRRGVHRLLLGSVAEHVVRTARVPVVVVRAAYRTPRRRKEPGNAFATTT